MQKLKAGTLLNQQASSLYKVLSVVYPEYEWLPWKFSNCPRNFWDDEKNQRKFMDWVGKELKIKDMSDWYKVSYRVKLPWFCSLLKLLQGFGQFAWENTVANEWWISWKGVV